MELFSDHATQEIFFTHTQPFRYTQYWYKVKLCRNYGIERLNTGLKWSAIVHRFNVKCFCSTPNSNTQYAILVLIIDIKFNIYRKSINLKYRGSLDCPFSWEKIGKSSWLSEVVLVKTKLATSIMKTHTRSSNMSIYSFWIENKFINFRQCQLDDVI